MYLSKVAPACPTITDGRDREKTVSLKNAKKKKKKKKEKQPTLE